MIEKLIWITCLTPILQRIKDAISRVQTKAAETDPEMDVKNKNFVNFEYFKVYELSLFKINCFTQIIIAFAKKFAESDLQL